MNKLKSHFVYDAQKRSGILILLAFILGALGVVLWYEPSDNFATSPEEDLQILAFQQEIDALKALAIEAKKPKKYPFNPNFMTDYRAYVHGLSVAEVDRLLRFRESGKWINSTADFKRITQVSDSLLAEISPYFKFPDWVTNPKPTSKPAYKRTWKTDAEKGKLNSLTAAQLLRLEGVDAQSADRIIKYREKIGGFVFKNQLYDVYGVPNDVVKAILAEYTVKDIPQIEQINVNTASASDLSTVPLLSYEMAKEIIDHRTLREGIKTIEELSKIDGMTDYKFERIRVYLKID